MEGFSEGKELGAEVANREAKVISGMEQSIGRGIRGIRTLIKYSDTVA